LFACIAGAYPNGAPLVLHLPKMTTKIRLGLGVSYSKKNFRFQMQKKSFIALTVAEINVLMRVIKLSVNVRFYA